MKKNMWNPFAAVSNLMRRAHIALANTAISCTETPQQRRWLMASYAVTCVGLFAASSAHADGVADMADKAAQQGDAITGSLAKLFKFGGFAGAGYGGYNWWRKGKEGEQSHVKGSQIFVPILAGAALASTGFIMGKAGETVGVQTSAQGQLPN